MFNSIKGVVSGKFPRQLHLESGGLEWDLCVPDSNLEMLPSVGGEARVFTWLHHTDQFMNLYGFATLEERSLFLDLLKVDGVGPKGAVKIMSGASSSRISDLLERGDVDMLEKIPGIGKRTAGKMMLALRGKLSFSKGAASIQVQSNVPYSDVVSSLCSMGYDKNVAQSKILEISERLSSDEGFSAKSRKDREDHVFRLAIVELA